MVLDPGPFSLNCLFLAICPYFKVIQLFLKVFHLPGYMVGRFGEQFSLRAQTVDNVDLKDGLLSNRVCTVKFPVGEFNFSSNTIHTELHCSASSWPENIKMFIHE